MTTFSAQVAQNQYLAQGTDLVHAVMSVTASPGSAAPVGGGTPPRTGAGPGAAAAITPATGKRMLVEAFLLDCSGSMEGEKLRSAKMAVGKSIDLLPDDACFCIIAGSDSAELAFPLGQATAENRRKAKAALAKISAGNGTAISTWLKLALQEFQKVPRAIHHALLLTDGNNQSETEARLAAVLQNCDGHFQCDARGIGTDWLPDQLRLISGKLLGTVDIIPGPEDIEEDFRSVIAAAVGKTVSDVSLRLWTPVGASVEFCKLVYPQTVDLTGRARVDPRNPQVRDYPTGSWGEEKRDYHICVKVVPGKVGQRMCAGRASLVVTEQGQENKVSEAVILAVWTDDEAQSAVINPSVAHYTGQAELAQAIQDGLKARAAGDEQLATALLGRAVQLAAESNPGTMKLLRQVVQVEDEKQGTVKLLKGVKKEDEFALDTRSTRTSRVDKS